MAQFVVRLNFTKYQPIFKIISLSESGENCNTTATTKDLTTPQMSVSRKQQLKTRRLP